MLGGSTDSCITSWLRRSPPWVLVLYAIATSFATYFCMYAFRKPFSVAKFEGEGVLGLELKTTFVISQILGYACSKFIGIKVCSEVTRDRRPILLGAFIVAAELALVLFAVVPPSLGIIPMFLNGLPLGMIWGLVVWYLEGRRTSELLLAGLSCSFIVSSGVVKDFGQWLMTSRGIGEQWMPAIAGLWFLPAFMGSVVLLHQVPHPDDKDIEARVEREPMGRRERRDFVQSFLPGLALLLVVYFFLTAYRDFRDNYQREIVEGLGLKLEAGLLSGMETRVAFGVLVPLALLVLVRDNRRGLLGAYTIMTVGAALLGVATLLFDQGNINGFLWMTLVGLGSYLAYVPFGSVLFDRVIASTRVAGTAVFAIYLADSIGYTGSIAVQVYKDFAGKSVSRLDFFRSFSYFLSILGVVALVASAAYFLRWGASASEHEERKPDAPGSDT